MTKLANKNLKKTQNKIYTLIVVLAILQVGTLIFIGVIIAKFDNRINQTNTDLTNKITDSLFNYDKQIQQQLSNVNQTVTSQTEQQTSFQEEIKNLKLSQSDFSGIIQDSLQSVVAVVTDKALGSGFIVTNDGYIVTNEHVVSDATIVQIVTSDKKRIDATIIGSDKVNDIALLKVNGTFHEIGIGNSDNLEIGNKVIAIGNPLGLSFSVTEGIVSGLQRKGPNNIKEYIQTDVPLNPGNSGGPLINTAGEVVGVNNFIIGGAENIGFALDSNVVRESVNNIANKTIA